MAQISGRYELESILGEGSYGITYLARDFHKPSRPYCVIKQLRHRTPKILELFRQEAVVLEKLGRHPQIPALIAYFAEGEQFYIAQDYIDGQSLRHEIYPGRPLNEAYVIRLLQDVLEVLSFVHQHRVIHRDIKPENLVRRQADGRIFLIDFGTVKELSGSDIDRQGTLHTTVTVGTSGYMPIEQKHGKPCLSSDLYALGMVAIEALTGVPPQQLEINPDTLEYQWQQYGQVGDPLTTLLNKLIRWHAKDRPASAHTALIELGQVFPDLDLDSREVEPTQREGLQTQENEATGVTPPPRPDWSSTTVATSDMTDAMGGIPNPVAASPAVAQTDVVAPAYQDDTVLPPALIPQSLPIKPILVGAGAAIAGLILWGMGLKAIDYWERWQPTSDITTNQPQYPEVGVDELVCVYQGCEPSERLRSEAFYAFWAMWKAAKDEGIQLTLLAGFQSIETQRNALANLPPSEQQRRLYYSDYHTGYGIAIGDKQQTDTHWQESFEKTAAFEWMQTHAARFGFELSHPKRNRDGMPYEPWHWRYTDGAIFSSP